MNEWIKTAADNLNALDWAIIVLAAASLIIGYIRGFVRQLLSVAGWIIAYLAAHSFYEKLSHMLQKSAPLAAWKEYDQYAFMVEGLKLDRYVYNAVAFALLFFGVKFLLSIFARIFDLLANLPGIAFFNKWGGVLLAFSETVIVFVIAVNVMNAIPATQVQHLLTNSKIVTWYMENAPAATEWLKVMWNK
ncbi:MAG TPA: CvpA family protein [Bacilli bacterium]